MCERQQALSSALHCIETTSIDEFVSAMAQVNHVIDLDINSTQSSCNPSRIKQSDFSSRKEEENLNLEKVFSIFEQHVDEIRKSSSFRGTPDQLEYLNEILK